MDVHVSVYELWILRLLDSLLDAKALMSNKKTGTLTKDDGIGNDDARKQWSDWLNEEK